MRLLIFLVTITFFSNSYAQRYQKSSDIGLMIGGAYYEGDLNYGSLFNDPRLAVAVMYKKNYSTRYSIRYALTVTELAATDSDFNKNQYQVIRDSKMDDNFIIDLSAMMEFNFFPITDDKNAHNFSPYVALGLALFNSDNIDRMLNLAVPLGIGVKYKLSPKWTLQAEWNYRLTFTDELDNLQYVSESRKYLKRQNSFDYTNDLYSVFGISILYQIRKKSADCPGYE